MRLVSGCPLKIRRLAYSLVVFAAVYVLINLLFKLQTREQDRGSNFVEHGKCPNYQHTSSFKYKVDPALETQVELELLQIQTELESRGNSTQPVRKIWQTSRDGKPWDVHEQNKWMTFNPGWDYKVSPRAESTSLYASSHKADHHRSSQIRIRGISSKMSSVP